MTKITLTVILYDSEIIMIEHDTQIYTFIKLSKDSDVELKI